MRRRLSLLLLSSTIAFGSIAQNRVIVGEKREAKKDARLEIVNPSGVNPGGLMLPFVELEATDKPNPLTTGSPAGTTTCEHLKGMIVYNTATVGSDPTAVRPGLYYNDGEKWIRVGDVNSEQLQGNYWSLDGNTVATEGKYLGTNDNNDLVVKRNNLEAARISHNPAGGIPAGKETTFDVKGNLKVGRMPKRNDTDLPVTYNPTTGELTAAPKDAPEKLFYKIDYEIKTGNGDWVKKWNTKIDATKYTVLMVRANFGALPIGDDNTPILTATRGTVPQDSYTSIEAGTWRINCDFKTVNPIHQANLSYAWHVTLLVVNNAMIGILPKVEGTANQSSGLGGATESPIP